jgi:hypothetical protein
VRRRCVSRANNVASRVRRFASTRAFVTPSLALANSFRCGNIARHAKI